MNDYVAIIAEIYEAFGRGDVDLILSKLSDDIRWEDWSDNFAQRSSVPWLQRRVGKEGVLQFFSLAAQFEIHEFRVLSLLAGENQVVAEVVIDATVPTGGRYRDEELHLWTFDSGGRVSRMRHYTDTAKHIAANEHA